MNFTMPMYQNSNWSNSGDTLLVFFDKDCGRCLPSINEREVFDSKTYTVPIFPVKPSASVLSCKPGIKRKVNERGWPSMRKEFLNGKDQSHESQRKFRGHITDFF